MDLNFVKLGYFRISFVMHMISLQRGEWLVNEYKEGGSCEIIQERIFTEKDKKFEIFMDGLKNSIF